MSERTSMLPIIELVVAAGANGVIGSKNRPIPWNLEDDVLRYRSLVRSKPVVVGRITHELIDEEVSDVATVVLSRSGYQSSSASVSVVSDLNECLNLLGAWQHVSVIGGAEVYRLFLPFASRIRLTEVHAHPVGYARFHVDPRQWRTVWLERHSADIRNEFDFTYRDLVRVASGRAEG